MGSYGLITAVDKLGYDWFLNSYVSVIISDTNSIKLKQNYNAH